MRFDAVGKFFGWAITVSILCGVFAINAIAQPGPPPTPPAPFHAVLNQPRLMGGKPWLWRGQKNQPPGNGSEAFVAYVRQASLTSTPEMVIRLYEAPSVSGGKLILTETYNLVLNANNEANSKNKKRRTFHYILRSEVTNPAGESLQNGKTRLFFITGTGLKSRPVNPNMPEGPQTQNSDRTLRITTLVINGSASSGGDQEIDCSDYPDDAVLEEEEYYQSTEYPATHDENDTWLTYSWQ